MIRKDEWKCPKRKLKKKRANQTNTTTGALGAEWEMGLEEEREEGSSEG